LLVPQWLPATLLVVGSINWDTIREYEKLPRRHNIHVPQERNETAMPGGHGLNQAVACVRLSKSKSQLGNADSNGGDDDDATGQPHIDLTVKMVGKVGDDREGGHAKAALEHHGVDTTHILETKEIRTGSADIELDDTGASTTRSRAYANDKLLPSDLPKFGKDVQSGLPDMILVQLEILETTVQALLQQVRSLPEDLKIPIILNAAPDRGRLPDDLYKVDHLIMNVPRADALFETEIGESDIPGDGDENQDGCGIGTWQTYISLCQKIISMGARCAVITMGKRGAVTVATQNGQVTELCYVAAKRRQETSTRDTIGASDAFIGAYAVELLRQEKLGLCEDVVAAVKMGVMAGGYSVGKLGSMQSIPWLDELRQVKMEYVPAGYTVAGRLN
jgi:ribokinase